MKSPVVYQKFLFDNRGTKPGDWLMLSIYKHNEYWNWKSNINYYKSPISFLSYNKWHFEIGLCIGKYSITLNRHFNR